MTRNRAASVLCLIALTVSALIVTRYPITAQEKGSAEKSADQPPPEAAKAESPEIAAVRDLNRLFREAYNRGDAKAIAALWTRDGEYDGVEAEPIKGQAAIEAIYARFFKENPNAELQGKTEAIRLLGSRAAVEEGTLSSHLPNEKVAGTTRFTAFVVLEEKGWRFASVREWIPESNEKVTLNDLAWLEGEWIGKGKQGEAHITYTFDENKMFMRSKYSVTRDGKVVRSGTQVLGTDPKGGVRSWQFESDGGFGEWAWSREGDRWVIASEGTLPDGTDETATHILMPVDKNTYIWQLVERTMGGEAQPAHPPVKVKRVQADK